MAKSTRKEPEKEQHHALEKLVGAVVIAGATYAANKYVESRKNRRHPVNKK